MVVEDNKFVDGPEKLSKRIVQPFLQLFLLERLGLRRIGDFLKSRSQNSLKDHLPKLVLKQFSIPHKNLEQSLDGR